MKTVNLYSTITEHSLVNQQAEGLHTYYNKKTNAFVILKAGKKVPSHILIVPNMSCYKSEIWRTFYSLLTEEELDVVNDYPYRRGFFEYLRETGLISNYYEAEEIVTVKVFKRWLEKNSINIDWETVRFDI